VLFFPQGETEKTLQLVTLSDDTPEVDEEYTITLRNIQTEGTAFTSLPYGCDIAKEPYIISSVWTTYHNVP